MIFACCVLFLRLLFVFLFFCCVVSSRASLVRATFRHFLLSSYPLLSSTTLQPVCCLTLDLVLPILADPRNELTDRLSRLVSRRRARPVRSLVSSPLLPAWYAHPHRSVTVFRRRINIGSWHCLRCSEEHRLAASRSISQRILTRVQVSNLGELPHVRSSNLLI